LKRFVVAMKVKAKPTGPAGQRLRVLLLAAACTPSKSSESGLGWHRALGAAQFFDTWVICGHWDQADIQQYLRENGEIPSLHFCFVKRWWLEDLLMLGRPLYEIHYLAHNLWHRRAFRLAARLHRELNFALVHQVSRTGFREPGYLWKLEAPFIWGPVGGTQNYPWRFLGFAGVHGALKEGLRSLLNWLQFHFSPRVRKAIRKATFLLASNSEIQRDFVRVHRAAPLVLLETGVNTVKNGLPEDKRQPGPLRILWSGRLEHHKALPLLLHALAQVPPGVRYELKILGDGPLRRGWQGLARQLGVEPRCRWLGWVPHHEAMGQYNWADVVVFTSLRDTSSNVVLEALSQGVPVICLDHQGVGDIVTDDCGVKIPVTTPREVIQSLREILISLAENRSRLEGLAWGALRRAREYLWSRNCEQMAKIYYAAWADRGTAPGGRDNPGPG
jgi:glycosyltransferase involved in cell wall biosynthesis